MFLFKKLLSGLLFPLPVSIELLAAGLSLLWFTRRQKAGKVIATTGLALLMLSSNWSFSTWVMSSLEDRYPPVMKAAAVSAQVSSPPKFVVVLASGFTFDPSLPSIAQLGATTLARLAEGIRIYRQVPGSKIIVSGGKVFSPAPVAQAMAKTAEGLGVNPQDLLLEMKSMDTAEEARLLKPIVGEEPFVLVTSAWHMPRAMALFRHAGLHPLPDPTDYLAESGKEVAPEDYFYPTVRSLRKTTNAVYEQLGMLWERLRGQL